MPEAIYTIRLDNGRELDVQSSSIDEAAARALKSYPEQVIVGWTVRETEEPDDTDGDTEDAGAEE